MASPSIELWNLLLILGGLGFMSEMKGVCLTSTVTNQKETRGREHYIHLLVFKFNN